MPVLNRDNNRKTVEYKMSSIDGGVIVLYNDFIQADLEFINEMHNSEEKLTVDQQNTKIIAQMIKSWNLTDEDENLLEPNHDNLSFVSITEKLLIMEATTWGRYLSLKSKEAVEEYNSKKKLN